MATDVYYNGVWLHNVTTRLFTQETVYDSSHTDSIGVRFNLRFDGIIQIQTLKGHADVNQLRNNPAPFTAYNSPNLDSTTNLSVEVRKRLSQPRGQLEVHTGDKILLLCKPTTVNTFNDVDRDTNNGPKPSSLALTQLYGNSIYRISFSIECQKLECTTTGYQTGLNPLINNRWAVSEDIDEDFFVVRAISGTITLSGAGMSPQDPANPLADARGWPIHWWKGSVVPGLELGFKRVSISFSASVDGLTAQYEIVDKQVHTAAPYPATKIDAQHNVSTNDGFTWRTDVSVRLWGAPNASKIDLITRALQIVSLKAKMDPATAGDTWLIESAQITDFIGESNSIQMSVRILALDTEGGYFAQLQSGTIGERLKLDALPGVPNSEYAPGISTPPAIWGYDVGEGTVERRPAVLWILSCYLQQPCSPSHDNNAAFTNVLGSGDPSAGGSLEPLGPTVTESSGGTLPTKPPEGANVDLLKEGIFTYCEVTEHYWTQTTRAFLPIAGGGSGPLHDSVVMINLAEEQAWREITYHAERIKRRPPRIRPMDSYIDGNLRGWLVSSSYVEEAPRRSKGQNAWLYGSKSVLVYRLNRAPNNDEKLRITPSPWTDLTVLDTTVAPDYLDKIAPGENPP